MIATLRKSRVSSFKQGNPIVMNRHTKEMEYVDFNTTINGYFDVFDLFITTDKPIIQGDIGLFYYLFDTYGNSLQSNVRHVKINKSTDQDYIHYWLLEPNIKSPFKTTGMYSTRTDSIFSVIASTNKSLNKKHNLITIPPSIIKKFIREKENVSNEFIIDWINKKIENEKR